MARIEVQGIRESRPATSVVDEILDAFDQHTLKNGPVKATEVHIPYSMEVRITAYYRESCGKTAREMVPTWKGIRKVVWGAKEFQACRPGAISVT
jgi:hypothetical protein